MGRVTGEPTQSLKTIVVAEDDPSSRELVCEILQAQGYNVVETCNGPDALDKIQELIPDLVLMDIQMPGAGGLTVIQQIRQDRRVARVPVVAVTAHAMAGDRERILSSGFDSYISKPVDAVVLRQRVKDLLQAGTPA